MAAQRYEISLQVLKNISRVSAFIGVYIIKSSNIFFCIVIHLSYFSKSNQNILCLLKIV